MSTGSAGTSVTSTAAMTEAQVVLEATPAYLYQRTAPDVLSRIDTQPELLFIFRRPSERAIRSSATSRAAPGSTRASTSGASSSSSGRGSAHPDAGARELRARLRQVQRLPAGLARALSPRAVHFFLFEDLRHDPRSFVKAVAVRLGLEPSFYDDYAPPTENRPPASEARGCTARRRAGRHVSRRTRERVKSVTAGAYSLVNVESSGSRRTSDEADVLAGLDAEFEPFNERLAELTGLDLAAWR